MFLMFPVSVLFLLFENSHKGTWCKILSVFTAKYLLSVDISGQMQLEYYLFFSLLHS